MAALDELQENCLDLVYCGISPEIRRGTTCVILRGFLDDTGSDKDSPRYTVAGYVAQLEAWDGPTEKWYDVLKQRPRLGFYRTSDAIALQGQFEHFDEPFRDKRIVELARVISDIPTCFGVSCRVSKEDFETYCKPVFHPLYHDPYYLCATVLIEALCSELTTLTGLERIDFIFDRQGKVGERYKFAFDNFLKPASLPLFPFLGEVKHEDKTIFLPLQMADMQAGWVRRANSLIQLWTKADTHLSRIAQKRYPVPQKFLERITQIGREDYDEQIRNLWDLTMKLRSGS